MVAAIFKKVYTERQVIVVLHSEMEGMEWSGGARTGDGNRVLLPDGW